MPTSLREFRQLAYAAFPTEPLPQKFFWSECEDPIEGDIPSELRNRLKDRYWSEIKLTDWLMVGVPCITRGYLDPMTYLYYLPSLLIGVFDDFDYLDWGIEGILPFNKTHTPRGTWWAAFNAAISESQLAALRSFLKLIRSTNPADLRDVVLLADAEAIWAP